MLWKTHIRISFEVLNRLGISLSPEETETFKKGIGKSTFKFLFIYLLLSIYN
jgi:hypothetical protein